LADEHLNPNRGWTVLHEGGAFTPDEIDHLKDCPQCSDWVALFADLSRKSVASAADPGLESETPFVVTLDAHLTPDRGWSLIRERKSLTPAEIGHLHYCKICNTWLTSFVVIARKAGFPISFEVPPLD
jgi:hypothetical protein